MRRILRAIMEVSRAENSQDNAFCATLQEVYPFLDRQIDGIQEPQPATGKLAEAMTTADFPYYFGRTLSRMVYDRYKYRMGDWRKFVFMDQVPDYSSAERFRFTEPERPVRRRDKEESYATYIEEDYLTIAVDDYAKQVDFSRRILKNDDLGAFNSLPQKMADATKRMEDWFVSALYDNAISQASLIALGALYAGTGRLTTANLAIGVNAFAQRVDGGGNVLSIPPMYLVIPPILELTAKQILQSDRIAELATNAKNVLQNSLQICIDPHIASAPPNVPWYLFAAPADIPALSVVRMQGQGEEPRLYAKAPDKIPMSLGGGLGAADWRLGSYVSGDIAIEVETTLGARNDSPATWVGLTDYQGIYYSTGTTP